MGKRSNHGVKRRELRFLWKHEMKEQAVGLAVASHVYAGDDAGNICVLDKATGAHLRSVKVPKAVRCIAADEHRALAGCNDGNVYDVSATAVTATSTPAPRVTHTLAPDMGIDWLELHRGRLYAADHEGGLTAFDVEGNVAWERRDDDARECWMVRADDGGVMHGCTAGLRAYDDEGALRWTEDVGDVRFGAVAGGFVVVTAGWMRRRDTALVLCGRDGRVRWSRPLAVDDDTYKPTGAESCACVHGPRGLRIIASCGDWLFAYDGAGRRLWEAPTGCGSCCNMQLLGDRLYVVTSAGTVSCLDVA